MAIEINIYRSGGEWCYATRINGEHDDSDTLDVADGASEYDADQSARAMYPGREVVVRRVADI